ncbi:MAG: hypothetical protein IKE85_02005 [Mogibacterium sp.]|nr:hypothetical protein [Mogibacterium sp.]MBR2539590.1 hypothetical protein [Mogibacterium sp.]
MTSYTGTIQLNTIPGAGAGMAEQTASKVRVRAASKRRSRRASRNLVLTATAIMTAIFILIGLSAYAASLQHANNVLAEQNAYLQAEIDSLNSQIIEETKVTRIEKIATEEYGMIYPTAENCIVISEDTESGQNLAATIRSEAYN